MNRLMMFLAGWNGHLALSATMSGLPIWLPLGAVLIAAFCLWRGLSPAPSRQKEDA